MENFAFSPPSQEKPSWRMFIVTSIFATLLLLIIPIIPTGALASNLIVNPLLEQASATDPTLPTGWFRGNWGTNRAIFSYPIVGQDGTNGQNVQMTAYTSGDAKWAFEHVPVIPGKSYTFSDFYQANVPTTITLEYKSSAGVFSYVWMDTLPATTVWTKYIGSFIPPTDTATVSVFHHINTI